MAELERLREEARRREGEDQAKKETLDEERKRREAEVASTKRHD